VASCRSRSGNISYVSAKRNFVPTVLKDVRQLHDRLAQYRLAGQRSDWFVTQLDEGFGIFERMKGGADAQPKTKADPNINLRILCAGVLGKAGHSSYVVGGVTGWSGDCLYRGPNSVAFNLEDCCAKDRKSIRPLAVSYRVARLWQVAKLYFFITKQYTSDSNVAGYFVVA